MTVRLIHNVLAATAATTIASGPIGALPQLGEPVVLESIEVGEGDGGDEVIISLRGSGRLSGTLQEISGRPFRIFVDLQEVVPGVSAITPVGRGNVERIRVALNRSDPPVTRVVLDLTSPQPYRLETDTEAGSLRIVVGASRSAPEQDYEAWFAHLSARTDRLLDTVSHDASGDINPNQLNPSGWSDLGAEIELRTPPPTFGVAHDLLKTVVRLGAVAGRVSDNSSQPVNDIDRSSAATGAKLLLARARTIVNGKLDPPGPIQAEHGSTAVR